MLFDKWLEVLKKPAQPKFYKIIHQDHILDPNYRPNPIPPNSAYFEIRLMERFLRYRSEFGRTFVPYTVIAGEFNYGGKSRTFPFFVGNELLQDIEQYVKDQDVDYRNTRIVGPVPYAGGDVALFVGLYRVPVDDLARNLLGFLGQVGSILTVNTLTGYVELAGKLADGLYSLFGFKQLEFRTGDRDVFQDHGSRIFGDGYLAYVNCAEAELDAEKLWVEDGKLLTGLSRGSLKPLRGYDYCLVQIQSQTTRNDYTNLPFHEIWKQAQDRVSMGDFGVAHTLFLECCRQIAGSSDLTPSHAQLLIQAYQANYAQAVEFSNKLHQMAPKYRSAVYRDAGGSAITPQQSILKTAQVANRAGVPEKMLRGLTELSKNWNQVPHLTGLKEDLTDEKINLQMAAIQRFSQTKEPNAKALAEALAVAAVTAG